MLNFRLLRARKLQGFVLLIGFDSRLATGRHQSASLALLPVIVVMLVVVYRGGLAQMAERPLCMRQARGSMPLSSIYHNNHSDECGGWQCRVRWFVGLSGDVAQMVERVLSMHEAMGSMPIFSTHYSLFARKHHQGFSPPGSIPSVRRHLYSRPFSSVGRAQVS